MKVSFSAFLQQTDKIQLTHTATLSHFFLLKNFETDDRNHLHHSNKCYTRGRKGRQDLQFSSVCITRAALFPAQQSSFGVSVFKWNHVYLSFLAVNYYIQSICVSVKRNLWKVAFQLRYIIFYSVLFLHHSLHYICYSTSKIGDGNISVSYPWADIHCKYAARFHKDIL